MTKWFFFLLCLANTSLLIAQKTVAVNPVLDTVKAKWGKVKIVNGVAMLSSNDFIENMSQAKEYSILVNAIENAGLTLTFKSKGPLTFFAPTNEAFAKLSAGQLDSLLKPGHKFDLSYLLTYHAVAGRITARDIQRKINLNNGQATYTTVAGSTLTAKIDSNRNIVLIDENGGESVISKFNIPQSNGLLHVVNSVLVPKIKAI
jgi:uncharacterized surface protein with fasciclin (FAS1) repeats